MSFDPLDPAIIEQTYRQYEDEMKLDIAKKMAKARGESTRNPHQ